MQSLFSVSIINGESRRGSAWRGRRVGTVERAEARNWPRVSEAHRVGAEAKTERKKKCGCCVSEQPTRPEKKKKRPDMVKNNTKCLAPTWRARVSSRNHCSC